METENGSQDLPSPTFQTLKTLERSWTGGSNESVQQWIDSLNEADFANALEAQERPMSPSIDVKNKPGSTFTDVSFLPLPGSQDDDELILGAEAKSLSRSSSCKGFSPRLSPLILDECEPVYPVCNGSVEIDAKENQENGEANENIIHNEVRKGCSDSIISKDTQSNAEKEIDKPNSDLRSNSVTSLQDIPSLLAAMGTDPEETLRFLGFCDQSMVSLLHRIPVRFLKHASEAKGIDTEKFYYDAMESEDQDSQQSSYDSDSRRRLLSRFSQSSIDLSNVEYDDYSLTRRRRSRMHEIIPSITIEPDYCDGSASDKNSPSRGSGNWRLSTVIEENEPGSRKSSFSKPDKRSPLQKQSNVEIAPDFDQIDYQEQIDSGIGQIESNSLHSDNTHVTLQHTAARLENLINRLEIIDNWRSDSEASNAHKYRAESREDGSGISNEAESQGKDDTMEMTLYDRRKQSSNELSSSSVSLKVVIPVLNSCYADNVTGINPGLSVEKSEEACPKEDYCIDNVFYTPSVENDASKEVLLLEKQPDMFLPCTNENQSTKTDISNFKEPDEEMLSEAYNTSEISDSEVDGANKIEKSVCDNPQKEDALDVCEHENKGIEIEKSSKKLLIQQFSVDSLEPDEQKTYADDNEVDDDKEVIMGPVLDCKGVASCKDFNFEPKATRIVYRTVEKLEHPDVEGENRLKNSMNKDGDDNNNIDKIERKPRSWSKRLMEKFDLKKADNLKISTDLKTIEIERSQSNPDKNRRSSLGIRDYFRRLASGKIRSPESMNDITDNFNKYAKSQSLVDLSGKDGYSTDKNINAEDGCFNREANSYCGEGTRNFDVKNKNRFVSQSMMDIRRRSLDFMPSRSSAFIDIEKLKYLLRTGHRPPSEPLIPDEADAIGKNAVNENGECREYNIGVTATNYLSLHRLGKGNSTQDTLTKCSDIGHCNVETKTRLTEDRLVKDNDYDDGEIKDIYSACTVSDRTNNIQDTCKYTDKAIATETLERFKPRFLTKGYSIESSGFEDEADACHLSPDRGTSCVENGKRQLYSHCMQRRIEKPILEKSLSSGSAVSRDLSKDSLEQKSFADESEASSGKKESGGSNDVKVPRMSTPIEVESTWKDNSHFDFLVNQITALRKEVSEQRETLEIYIDDRMERMKTSILTEISILNASQKISSPNNSHVTTE